MNDKPVSRKRRSIRLNRFDYSQPGAYFVTICAHRGKCLFGKIRSDELQLTEVGNIVRACWLEIPRHFINVELRAEVVMPNHMHGILVIHERARRFVTQGKCSVSPLVPDINHEEFGAPAPGSLPTIIRSFKSAVSRQARQILRSSAMRIWQRNYYERRIRNKHEFIATCEYIRDNPSRWRFDKENPEGNAADNDLLIG